MKKMNIAIIGTRGIPNNYGGFEQLAEYLSKGLCGKGHTVTVYNPHNHPYRQNHWDKVNIVHRFDPEFLVGAFGQFIYDFNCIIDTRKKQYDIILQLGYTSSAVWNFLLPSGSIIITNMDGMEWKRAKYSNPVKRFLKYSEKLAVKHSNKLVADSAGIGNYLQSVYQINPVFIPYGAIPVTDTDEGVLNQFGVSPFSYDMLIARMEPENNIEMILDGYLMAGATRPFIAIGNCKNSYGRYIVKKFGNVPALHFPGAIYNTSALNTLRYYSNVYFHGHSAGGTNPSLLEAMASKALICAHDNPFNASVLGNDAYYFSASSAIAEILAGVTKNDAEKPKTEKNFKKIKEVYNWENIINRYEEVFFNSIRKQQ